jgi:hypothetical protein
MRAALTHLHDLGDCCGAGPCERKRGERDDSCRLRDVRRTLMNTLYAK